VPAWRRRAERLSIGAAVATGPCHRLPLVDGDGFTMSRFMAGSAEAGRPSCGRGGCGAPPARQHAHHGGHHDLQWHAQTQVGRYAPAGPADHQQIKVPVSSSATTAMPARIHHQVPPL
jgi:hypothetical protein